ncbi:hypothetical protein IWW55_006309, partial [Coemansia sp. RSA 2706]
NDIFDFAKQALSTLIDHLGAPIEKDSIANITASLITESVKSPFILLEALPESFAIGGTANANQVYLQQADGSIAPTWRVNVEQQDNWWNAQVD